MTDDDALLRACSELDREDEAAYPQVWEHALAGRTAIDAACADPSVRPDEAEILRALFDRPIAADEIDSLVGRALAVVQTTRPAAAPDPAPTPPAPPPGVVVPLRRRWRGLAAVAGLAAAAAVLVLVLPAETTTTPARYELSPRDTPVEPVRSSAAAPGVRRYVAASTIDWVWSPDTAVDAAVQLYAVARDAGGHERLLAPPATRSPSGTLHLRGRIDPLLGLEPGRWHLRFVVSAVHLADLDAAHAALAAGAAASAGELEIELSR